MSKHQDILDNLVVRLKTITQRGGYSINLNNAVYEWDTKRNIDTIDETELPIVDIRDQDPVQITWSGIFTYDLPIEISIWASAVTSKEDARQIVFDIFKSINTDRTLSGVADEIYPESYQVDVQQGENLLTNVNLQLRIRFATEPWESE